MKLGVAGRVVKHLSYSTVSMFRRCQTQVWFKNVHGYARPNGAGSLGRWAHKAVEQYLLRKMEGHSEMELKRFLGVFETAFDKEQKKGDIDWKGEDPGAMKTRFMGVKGVSTQGTKIIAPRRGVLPLVHAEHLPKLQPELVEHKIEDVEIEALEGCSFDSIPVVGYVDFYGTEKGKKQKQVRDSKFRGRKHNDFQEAVDYQLPLYQLALEAEGKKVNEVVTDQFIHKASGADIHEFKRKPDEDQKQRTVYAFQSTALQMERNGDDPDNWGKAPPDSWWCSQKWCGWWDHCPAGGGGNYVK